MAVNRYRPHVYVLPEDDANREVANGFQLFESVDPRVIQVIPHLRGWPDVRNTFHSQYVPILHNSELAHIILLVDFDEDANRPTAMNIPSDVASRVFVLGAWSEPEDLRKELGSFERIGQQLAEECRKGTEIIWSHALLKHNAAELVRMQQIIKPILFPQ